MYFVLMGECNPRNKLCTLEERLFTPPKGKLVEKRAESHRCEVNTFGILACNISTVFEVSQRDSFYKNRLENLNRMTHSSQKNF